MSKGIRHICYITGTRADFGLMLQTLQRLDAVPGLQVSVLATGMHLQSAYGYTISEVEASGLAVSGRVEVETGVPDGALMARNIGRMLIGFTEILETVRPDIVLLLGDRGEMLAAAIAAQHLNIPIAHIHGGERSGTVDEPVRHAISKLAHIHLVATDESRERLIRMGEAPDQVHVVGAPGLDSILSMPLPDRTTQLTHYGFDAYRPLALLVYHPVLHEATEAGRQIGSILDALMARNVQILALRPNSDAGSQALLDVLERRAATGQIRLVTHLPRDEFIALMAVADLMIGNSSSGIIEAASFGTPVLNLGSRQNMRQRNINTRDEPIDSSRIEEAITDMLASGRFARANVYGDGTASAAITRVLADAELSLLTNGKVNAY